MGLFSLFHLPDIICLYRTFISIIALIYGPHPLTPWLFSSALISDLFDGYIYRKYVVNNQHYKPWWPLPISLDMVGDLSLIVCGLIYAYVYLYHTGWLMAVLYAALFALLALICVVLPNIVPKRIARGVYTASMTALTHGACLLMLHSAIASWIVYSKWWPVYAGATVAVFYGIFALIGNRSRLIRHPPANFRKPS